MDRIKIARELLGAARIIARGYDPLNPDLYLANLRKWRPESDYLHSYIDGYVPNLVVVKKADYTGGYELNKPPSRTLSIADLMWEISEEMDTNRYWDKRDIKELLSYNSFVSEFRKIIATKFRGEKAVFYGEDLDDDFEYESSEGEFSQYELNEFNNAGDKIFRQLEDSEFPAILAATLKGKTFTIFIKKFGESKEFSNFLEELDDRIVPLIEDKRMDDYDDSDPYFDLDRALRPY